MDTLYHFHFYFDAAMLLLIIFCQVLGIPAPIWVWLAILLASIAYREWQYKESHQPAQPPVQTVPTESPPPPTPENLAPPQRRMQHPDVRAFYSDCLSTLDDKRPSGYRMTRGYDMS